MTIQIQNLGNEFVRVLNAIRDVLADGEVVSGMQQLRRDIEQPPELLVGQHDGVCVIHYQDPVNRRLGLRLQQRRLEQQRLLGPLAVGNVDVLHQDANRAGRKPRHPAKEPPALGRRIAGVLRRIQVPLPAQNGPHPMGERLCFPGVRARGPLAHIQVPGSLQAAVLQLVGGGSARSLVGP